MRLFSRFLRWITGYYAVSVGGRELIDAVTVMMKRSVDYRDLKLTEGGGGTFLVSRKGYRELIRLLGDRADSVKILREYGLPYLIRRYRRRPGIAVGALLFFSLCFLSERFLWDIDVTGNETISDVEVIETLSSLGCSIGTPVSAVDFFSLGNGYLASEPRASFAAVNREGTTVHVVLREKKLPSGGTPDAGAPSNLVSAVNGRIVSSEVSSGKLLVRAGDVVTEGQLLVSGVVTKRGDESGVFRLERSVGRVFAEWETGVSVSIPFSRTVTVEKSRREVGKTVILFGKPIKIFEKYSNPGAMYDIIEKRERVILFGFLRLPLYTVTEYEIGRGETEVTLTPTEAEAEAERALARAILAAVGDGELTEKEITAERNEEGVTLRARLTVVTDVAEEVPITVLP